MPSSIFSSFNVRPSPRESRITIDRYWRIGRPQICRRHEEYSSWTVTRICGLTWPCGCCLLAHHIGYSQVLVMVMVPDGRHFFHALFPFLAFLFAPMAPSCQVECNATSIVGFPMMDVPHVVCRQTSPVQSLGFALSCTWQLWLPDKGTEG